LNGSAYQGGHLLLAPQRRAASRALPGVALHAAALLGRQQAQGVVSQQGERVFRISHTNYIHPFPTTGATPNLVIANLLIS
jgi:hypothetical protein